MHNSVPSSSSWADFSRDPHFTSLVYREYGFAVFLCRESSHLSQFELSVCCRLHEISRAVPNRLEGLIFGADDYAADVSAVYGIFLQFPLLFAVPHHIHFLLFIVKGFSESIALCNICLVCFWQNAKSWGKWSHSFLGVFSCFSYSISWQSIEIVKLSEESPQKDLFLLMTHFGLLWHCVFVCRLPPHQCTTSSLK